MSGKCLFCNGEKSDNRPKFCSYKCVKRAWYVQRNPNAFNSAYFDQTETGIGFRWEKVAAKLLGARHLEFNKLGADLEKDGIFFEVKTSKIHRRKMKRGKPVVKNQLGIFSFKGDNKYSPRASFFFCIGVGDDGNIFKCFLIPENKYPIHGISVGVGHSKYDEFIFKIEASESLG